MEEISEDRNCYFSENQREVFVGLLENEIITTMGLLGVTRLDQLSAAHLSKVQPMAPTHEMSAFPHMPGGRLF